MHWTRESIQRNVELLANLCLAIAAVTATWFIVDRANGEPPRAPVAVYDPAETLPEGLPASVFDAKRVVLVHVRSTCGFCTASMPFYRALAAQRGPSTKVVVVGSEPETVLSAYLQKQGFKPDQVVHVDKEFFRDSTTPLIVVADSTRTVLNSWMGMLDEPGEKAALKLALE